MIVKDNLWPLYIQIIENGLNIERLKYNILMSTKSWMRNIGVNKMNGLLFYLCIEKFIWEICKFNNLIKKEPENLKIKNKNELKSNLKIDLNKWFEYYFYQNNIIKRIFSFIIYICQLKGLFQSLYSLKHFYSSYIIHFIKKM